MRGVAPLDGAGATDVTVSMLAKSLSMLEA